jgi:hypothetical protein
MKTCSKFPTGWLLWIINERYNFFERTQAPLEKAADEVIAVSWRFAPSKQRKKPTLASLVRLIRRFLSVKFPIFTGFVKACISHKGSFMRQRKCQRKAKLQAEISEAYLTVC